MFISSSSFIEVENDAAPYTANFNLRIPTSYCGLFRKNPLWPGEFCHLDKLWFGFPLQTRSLKSSLHL